VKLAINWFIFGIKSFMDYRAFQHLSYGLYLVATALNNRKAGYIANTVFQVTSKPPRVAVSCHKENESLKVILESKVFSVNVLAKETPAGLIGNFGYMSGSEIDKFAGIETISGITGAPVVSSSCLAWLDCRVEETLDLGTHMLIIGQVADSAVLAEGEPLTYRYYRKKFRMVSPVHAPTYIENEKLHPQNVSEKQPAADIPGTSQEDDNEPYICAICGHIYRPEEGDPSVGIPPGTPFNKLPEEYRCPICNAGKDYFKPM
jgi:flavin reductase (DIM6/NTAB) family NADH-FMN oxidoreductase RutF/rubredoxin